MESSGDSMVISVEQKRDLIISIFGGSEATPFGELFKGGRFAPPKEINNYNLSFLLFGRPKKNRRMESSGYSMVISMEQKRD